MSINKHKVEISSNTKLLFKHSGILVYKSIILVWFIHLGKHSKYYIKNAEYVSNPQVLERNIEGDELCRQTSTAQIHKKTHAHAFNTVLSPRHPVALPPALIFTHEQSIWLGVHTNAHTLEHTCTNTHIYLSMGVITDKCTAQFLQFINLTI